VAAHVLARRQAAVTGRISLRTSPGGLTTPAFAGPDGPEVVRLAGDVLVREIGDRAVFVPADGASLDELARAVGVDLASGFDAGRDTPAIGDPDEPLALPADAVTALGEWWLLGWQAIDTVVGELGPGAEPSVTRLWPEHFDAAADVAAAPDRRANLGASPGDGYQSQPYLYVGPWQVARPGPPGYWNAPFGSVLTRAELEISGDPVGAACDFLREGVRRLAE